MAQGLQSQEPPHVRGQERRRQADARRARRMARCAGIAGSRPNRRNRARSRPRLCPRPSTRTATASSAFANCGTQVGGSKRWAVWSPAWSDWNRAPQFLRIAVSQSTSEDRGVQARADRASVVPGDGPQRRWRRLASRVRRSRIGIRPAGHESRWAHSTRRGEQGH